MSDHPGDAARDRDREHDRDRDVDVERPLVNIDDYEVAASELLTRSAFDYYAGGAGDEWTLAENRRAFDRWVFRPRALVDVANVDLATTVVGQPIPFPILLAPTAFQRMAHPDGEMASARAAASLGALMVASTIASTTLEDIASTGVDRWFQLYVHSDRGLTADLVGRAHAAGYRALVLTVDTPRLGRREREQRNRTSLPPGVTIANMAHLPIPEVEGGSGLLAYFASITDPSVTWDDVAWLRSLSPMPLLLKGVVVAEDAELAAQAGVDGVIVSNHGGRQLDGLPATLDVLPGVVAAVDGRMDVLMDGGIRRGSHVLKALALGARAVLIGRPYLWGLSVDGEGGVRAVLELLRDELSLTMALAGVRSVAEVGPAIVAPASADRERGAS